MYHYIFSITTILFLSFTTLGYTQKSLGKTYKSTETFNLNGKVKYMTVSSYNLSKDGKNTPILAAKEDYYFNEEGNVVKEKFYRNEELIFEQNFSFDKKGYPISTEATLYKKDGDTKIIKGIYTNDTYGNVIKIAFYEDNSLKDVIHQKIDNQQNTTTISKYDAEGNLEERQEKNYNNKGDIIEERTYNSKGEITAKTTYSYLSDKKYEKLTYIPRYMKIEYKGVIELDAHKNIIKETQERYDGSWIFEHTYTYDKHQNYTIKSSKAFITENNKKETTGGIEKRSIEYYQ